MSDAHTNLFTLFGGIRPMARALNLSPSNVSSWKREGRIPSTQQPLVLDVGRANGLPITAEDVVFPLGRPAEDLATPTTGVACRRSVEQQNSAQGSSK
jgi:hypothetical protein